MPTCSALQVAPGTYYAAKARPPSARARRDAELGPQLLELWQENYRVYGACKLWKAARRAGIDVGRDQVACLGHLPLAGGCSRMIVGWRAASHMRTGMVLDAVEMARWSRGTQLAGLRCHSDAGSLGGFTSLRYGERLAEIGAVPSIGSVGDSYAGALAETVNGYDKAELIRGPAHQGPWKSVEDVELATLGWVHWHNTARLHGHLGDVPPAEFEAAAYAATGSDPLEVELPTLEPL